MKYTVKNEMFTLKMDCFKYTLEYSLYAENNADQVSYSISAKVTPINFNDSSMVNKFTEDAAFAEDVFNLVSNNLLFPCHLENVISDMLNKKSEQENLYEKNNSERQNLKASKNYEQQFLAVHDKP